jgi:hypothetical protein
VDFDEEENEINDEQTEMIFSREEISVAMNIDPDLRSTKLVYGLAQYVHDEDLNELQAAVRGEITPGSMIEVDPATALKAARIILHLFGRIMPQRNTYSRITKNLIKNLS